MHVRGQWIGGDLGDHLGVGSRLVRPDPRDHDHGQHLEAPDQIGDEAKRRVIDPVEVVDRQQQRLLSRELERHPVATVQGREADRFGVLARGRDLEHGPRRLRRAFEGALAHLRIGQRRLEQLAHDAVGELRLDRRSASGQHPDAIGLGVRRASPSRLVLPIPAGPSISPRRGPRPSGAGHEFVQGRDLPLALQKHAAILVPTRPRPCPRPGTSRGRDRASPRPRRAGRRRTPSAARAAESRPRPARLRDRRSRGCRGRS